MVRGAFAAILVLWSLASYADDARLRSAEGPVFAAEAAAPPPLRSARAAEVVISTLGASADDIAGLRAANSGPSGVLHSGVVRELDEPLRVTSGPAALTDGPWRWRGSVHAEGAARVRLRLDQVNLPADARLWIYSGDEVVSFTPALAYAGSLWTPSVGGEVATLEVEASGGEFTVSALADNRDFREVAPTGTECLRDAACQPGFEVFARAIARISFVSGSKSYVCSGGLLNSDTTATKIPYFLTANHCISTHAEAASVEAFWDYRAAICNGTAPSLGSVPRTSGASLTVTSTASDMTLLRLSSTPTGRTLLGWDPSSTLAGGVTLFRVSHPDGGPLHYTQGLTNVTSSTCTSLPRPNYHYSSTTIGGTTPGSSGSPVMYDVNGGYVIGQLSAGCGPEPANPCNRLNYDVDGSFAASWPLLQPFLRPTPTAGCAACTPNSTTACMLDNRFKVTATWSDGSFGSGPGLPIRFAENKAQTHPEHGAILETTFFAFYPFFPTSVESMVKMTKGVGINNKYWVFITGFTGASYTVNVQDTKTCATWSKAIAPNATAALRDYEAFPLN